MQLKLQGDNLNNKNSRILHILFNLEYSLRHNNLTIADNWQDDEESIGITNSSKTKLIYIRAKGDESNYYLSMEASSNVDVTSLSSKDFNNISMSDLISKVIEFFEIETKVNIDNTIHILNGDALYEQFPNEISGHRIVMRECLVDGVVSNQNLESFLHERALFICKECGEKNVTDYYLKAGKEILQLPYLNSNAQIYLWFEDDLFCQVNLWFVCSLIYKHDNHKNVKMVRTLPHAPFSFAHHSTEQLLEIYARPLGSIDLSIFNNLWEAYCINDTETLLEISKQINIKFPMVLNAVNAHIDRLPVLDLIPNDEMSKLSKSIIGIINEPDTNSFGIAFQKFNKRYPIYGFGDFQFKRMYDRLILNTN